MVRLKLFGFLTSLLLCDGVAFGQPNERGQVSLNLTLLSLSDRTCERLGIGAAQWSHNDGIKHILLDDARFSQFVEAVQRDQLTTIMQAPKLTVFDGQDAYINVFDSLAFPTGAIIESNDGTQKVVPTNELIFVGTKSRVLSTISEDRKNVSVQAEIATRFLNGGPGWFRSEDSKSAPKLPTEKPVIKEIKIAVACKVPDQRTIALVAGKAVVDVKAPFGPPILSKIGYISRLFSNPDLARNSGPQMTTIVVLMTPRIIAPEQETAHVERLMSGIQAPPMIDSR